MSVRRLCGGRLAIPLSSLRLRQQIGNHISVWYGADGSLIMFGGDGGFNDSWVSTDGGHSWTAIANAVAHRFLQMNDPCAVQNPATGALYLIGGYIPGNVDVCEYGVDEYGRAVMDERGVDGGDK